MVLEQELQGLAALGGVGVFCATGDGRAPGVRDEVTQVLLGRDDTAAHVEC